MPPPPGHNSGHESSEPSSAEIPAGYTWADFIEALVAAEGSLTAIAQKLFARGTETDDVNSVERALRRLRSRGQRDGGVWGQRLLRAFGMPQSVEARLRWMGVYHSPFNDLPVGLCLDLLRVWDRPPVSESKARVYLQLGFASASLRLREFTAARAHLAAARSGLATSQEGAALVEHALSLAYLESREARDKVPNLLDEAERALAAADLEAGERAASYRREAGLAYGKHALGDREAALRHAQAAIRHAGDGGFVRLRVMGLLLEARILGSEGKQSLERAHAIALRLGDEELLSRVRRAQTPAARAD